MYLAAQLSVLYQSLGFVLEAREPLHFLGGLSYLFRLALRR